MSQTGEQRSGLQQKASPGKPESLWPAGQAAAHATSMPRRSGSSLGLVIAHPAAVQRPEFSLASRLQQRWVCINGQLHDLLSSLWQLRQTQQQATDAVRPPEVITL